MADIYFSLGSNSGDRLSNLRNAVKLLSKKIQHTKYSSVYESPAWGYRDDTNYFNIVVSGTTDYTAEQVLDIALKVEQTMGRKRPASLSYQARNIDIDLLLYNQHIITGSALTLPHPRMHLRNFVLVPFCELAPDVIHPVYKVPMRVLLQNSPDTDIPLKLPDEF